MNPPKWTDFPSYCDYVRASCARLQAPEPPLRVMELEYPARCAELARARAVNEVMESRGRDRCSRLEVAR